MASVLQHGNKPCVSRKSWVGLSSDESDRVMGKASPSTHPLAGTREKQGRVWGAIPGGGKARQEHTQGAAGHQDGRKTDPPRLNTGPWFVCVRSPV